MFVQAGSRKLQWFGSCGLSAENRSAVYEHPGAIRIRRPFPATNTLSSQKPAVHIRYTCTMCLRSLQIFKYKSLACICKHPQHFIHKKQTLQISGCLISVLACKYSVSLPLNSHTVPLSNCMGQTAFMVAFSACRLLYLCCCWSLPEHDT